MSSLTRWEPFVSPMSLRGAMERLFGDRFLPPSLFRPLGLDLALDMYETDSDLVLKVTVPGVKPEDIQITIVGQTLTVKGEVKAEEEVEERNYIQRERRWGTFCRSVTLPDNVNAEQTKAQFEDGILTLIVPKVEEVKPKAIRVKVK